jgi:RNA polymerase sigma-70 factor (ECF subfamily)
LRHLLSHERQKEQSVKRGGLYSFVPLDEILGEDRYSMEPEDGSTPEKLFERRWAMMLLHQTMEALQREYIESGRSQMFEALNFCLSGSHDASTSYAEIGERLGLNENAARQAAFRLRTRFGDLFREQIARTVSGPKELEDELAHIRVVLGG